MGKAVVERFAVRFQAGRKKLDQPSLAGGEES
jgi:hypothetical protein